MQRKEQLNGDSPEFELCKLMAARDIFGQRTALLILHHQVNVIVTLVDLKELECAATVHEQPLNLDFLN